MVSWAALLAPRDPDTSAELTKAGVEVAYEPPASYEQRVLRESPWIRRAVQQTGMTVE